MSYAVIIGKSKRTLEAVLRLPQWEASAATLLKAYERREYEYRNWPEAMLLCRPDGKWALLCHRERSIKVFRPKIMALTRRVNVVPHQVFVVDPDWRDVVKEVE